MSQAFRDFAKGMGQAFDIGGALGPVRAASTRATQGQAIRSYWSAVGKGMRHTMSEAAKTSGKAE